MTEDQLINRIAIEAALQRLEPDDEAMMRLIYGLDGPPPDWTYGSLPWPPKYEDIGLYIGLKFEGEPISEATVRYRRDVVKAYWAGTREKLRRTRKSAQKPATNRLIPKPDTSGTPGQRKGGDATT